MRKLVFISLIIVLGEWITAPCQVPVKSARTLYLDSKAAFARGDFKQSEAYLNRILDGEYQLSGLTLAMVHNSLGLVCYETGSVKEALQHYRKAESYTSGPGTLNVRISIYNNLAIYYNWLGDYINALDHYDKAIRLLDSVPSGDEAYFSKLSMLQFNKGIVYYRLGRPEEALEFLKKSEQIKEAHGFEYLGSVYLNLARADQLLGESALAARYYRKSIDRWIAEYDADYYQLANVYLQYGAFLLEQGEAEQSYHFLQEALRTYLSNYGIRHPLTSGCYEQLSRYYLEQGDIGQALESVQLALISVSASFNDQQIFSNPPGESSLHDLTLLKAYATKTKALERLADEADEAQKPKIITAALESNSRSIDVLHRLQESTLSGESRIHLTSGQKELFHTGIQLNIKMFTLTGQESFKENAYLTAARGKSNELLLEMKRKEWLYLENLPDSSALSVVELKKQIDQFSNLIQTENMEIRPDSAILASWKEQLFYTRDSFNRQMEKLSLDHPQINRIGSFEPHCPMKQVRQNMKQKETLVEYFISNPDPTGLRALSVFVVTKKACHIYQDQLDHSFSQELDIVVQNLHQFDPFRETLQHYDSLKIALFNIYRQLLQPVESWFGGKQLIIVPDEELAYLPFGVLIGSYEPENILNYAGLPYLMNSYDITYMVNSLLIQRERKPHLRFPGIVAWLADYGASAESSFRNLEGSSEEVREILTIAKGKSILNPDKDEAEKILEKDAIIHLAMHAQAGEESGGSPCFILNSEKDSSFNNRLFDYEINALTLSSPMVVLSSCKSGAGPLQESEGIMSLSRSFLMAGAESVVHTLWPVEDKKGAEIMVEYYRELKRGKSKSRALTMAKQQYMVNNPPSWTHPYYWAAYQITGNPVSLTHTKRFVIIPGLILVIFFSLCYFTRCSLRSRD